MQKASFIIVVWEITLFSNTMLFRVSRFVQKLLSYQQLSIACYQVSFYAKNYFLVITNSVQCI